MDGKSCPSIGMRRVHVIAMGGTISAKASVDQPGYAPALTASELLQQVAWSGPVDITCEDLGRMLSFGLTFELAARLVKRIGEVLQTPDVSGCVVTHGTAVLEEMAFLCDLTVDSTKPVVFTGAIYSASDLGSDGPRNVRDAVRVAASPASAGRGVLVVFGGEIHTARNVVKLHKYSLLPFVSSPLGPIGRVDPAGVVYYAGEVSGRVHLPFPPPPFPRVEIVTASLGADDYLIRAALKAPSQGLVLEGFPGSGGVPSAWVPAIRAALERGIPVVLTSRALHGRTVPLAGGESGPALLTQMGVILGGDLTTTKARILLIVALGNSLSEEEIKSLFARAARSGGTST